MTVYRIKLFTDRENHDSDKEYCLEHNLVAIGWGLNNVDNVNTYKNLIRNEYTSKGFKSSFNKICGMNIGDYVWTKVDGMDYRLGKIISDMFLLPDYKDGRMGLTRKCEWRKVEFNDVPGKILSCFLVGYTLTGVKMDEDFEKYCKWLYDGKKPEDKIIISNYKNLLHSDDLEDLLGIYLQAHGDNNGEKYIIIPSTNKQSTKYIEYELLNSKGEKACVQCKIGNSSVDSPIFEKFKNYKIFICTLNENKNYDADNVEVIRVDTLWNWAKEHNYLLPDRIKNYITLTNK